MKTTDIKRVLKDAPDTIYRVVLGRVDTRAGSVNLLQGGYVQAQVLDVGPHVHEEYVRWVQAQGGRHRYNEEKRTVKLKIIRGLGDDAGPYGNANDGDTRFCATRQVLIVHEEAQRLEREHAERRAAYLAEVEAKTAENAAKAEELNQLQIEAGFSATDYIGNPTGVIAFGVDRNGNLTRTIRGSVEDLVRAAAAHKREEVSA